MLFFTLPNSQHVAAVSGGGFFSWGTKFKYTGRTEREILAESINSLRKQKLNNSAASKRKASSVPATPSSPQSDLVQIRYSSLPRSTMCEPLTMLTALDVFTENFGCDGTGYSNVQVPDLEPVSEETRLKASTNLKNINTLNICVNTDMPKFYMTSEDSLLYTSSCSENLNLYKSENSILPHSSENQQTSFFQQELSHNTGSNSHAISSNTSINSGNSTIENKYNSSAKKARKFHFMSAFIPSFVFVVFTTIISAVIVLESDSVYFEQLRNLPEMVSLRYQYYEPLKTYFLQKTGRKT